MQFDDYQKKLDRNNIGYMKEKKTLIFAQFFFFGFHILEFGLIAIFFSYDIFAFQSPY